MIKKSLPIALSTLAIGLGSLSSSPAFASVLAPGQTAYTAQELISTVDELYQEMNVACETTDLDCARSFYWEKGMDESLRDALDEFYRHPFLVTSVNPSAGTVKIYFQSRDPLNMWFRASNGPATVSHLYMGWDDANTDASLATVGTIYPISEAHLMPDHFHYIYPTTTEEGNWPPTGVEYTIELGNDSLLANTNGFLEYNFGTQYTTDYGYMDYLSCINSQYYREGMECRMIFSPSSEYQFVPFLNGVPAYPPYTSNGGSTSSGDSSPGDASPSISTPVDDSTPMPANNSASASVKDGPSTSSVDSTTSNTTNNSTNSTTNNTANNSKTYNNYPTKALIRKPVLLAKTIKGKASNNTSSSSTSEGSANDTSVSSNLNDSNTTEVPLGGGEAKTSCAAEFPWWLIVIMLGLDVAVMWLLYPKKSKKI